MHLCNIHGSLHVAEYSVDKFIVIIVTILPTIASYKLSWFDDTGLFNRRETGLQRQMKVKFVIVGKPFVVINSKGRGNHRS